jgi:hypothetical protein
MVVTKPRRCTQWRNRILSADETLGPRFNSHGPGWALFTVQPGYRHVPIFLSASIMTYNLS